MRNKKKAFAIVLAAAMTCGTLAGCDALTTTNVAKDYAQTIAEVDLTRSADFAEGGKFAAFRDLVTTATISKRDMVASYLSSGYSVQQQYNWTYADTFDTIADTLVSRQVFVQYAKVYLAQNGDKDGNQYTVEGYKAAVGSLEGDAAEIAGLGYFLTEDERLKADYDLMVSINNTIDSAEQGYIDLADDEHEHTADADVRTLPTGAETEADDYFPVTVVNDKKQVNYGIYTGREDSATLGEYEKLDGSTVTTRKKAYVQFLSSLLSNNLIEKGEDTNDFYSTSYYAIEQKSAYEAAIINKMSEKFGVETEAAITEASAQAQFDKDLESNKVSYKSDKSAFESALDKMSDTSFVLAPFNEDYGFVINILLPFSDLQTQMLGEVSSDLGDTKGNHFAARAMLLKALRATDQRGTWFTGHEDYSFEGGADAFKGAEDTEENAKREWLFFENSFNEPAEGETAKYEVLKNYYGKYTYNGTVTKTEADDGDTEYEIKPNKIDIDDFLAEMKAYLKQAGVEVSVEKEATDAYYTNENYYYTEGFTDQDGTVHKAGDVDYDAFIYETGKIGYFNENYYDANQIFKKGTKENIALSVINELSFAYNTDTAGLNTYLGYSVSPYKTSYMSEFEYAAQQVVKNGAGSYAVVPTDYGWHIIYCTFSFRDAADAGKNAFEFTWAQDRKFEEGTFSYLYYESLKSTAVSTFTSNRQSDAIDTYVDDCSTIFEDRFADLKDLDNHT